MKAFEWNFDGLVGPTHNYAGLSLGNVASLKNAKQISHPKDAALQGLKKMKTLAGMGYKQGVLSPQLRPDLRMLKRLGFTGSTAELLQKAGREAPHLLAACYSASSMWTANAATVSPSADTGDKKVHFTPANLVSKFHRSIEPTTTGHILQATFKDDRYFKHHTALPSTPHLGDEGAANHTRFAKNYQSTGVEFFVYGHIAFNTSHPAPKRFPARQSLEASEAIARSHGVDPKRTVFAQQSPEVIDQGVFHNDVISVGNLDTLFMHEQAFMNKEATLSELKQKLSSYFELKVVEVPSKDVSVQDAVESYLFNSQLLEKIDGSGMVLVCPEESRKNERVRVYLESLQNSGGPIQEVIYLDVTQSMQNGGGPACLRLRVVLTEEEQKGVNPKTILSDDLYQKLVSWVEANYRGELSAKDLTDPKLVDECYKALDELTQIMDLGSVYDFQK